MNSTYRAQLLAGEQLGHRYGLSIPTAALSGATGTLLGRQAGTSIDFQEHRDYQPGDDLRRIDWNIFARSDRLAVKLYREEVIPHLDLVLDGSRSMALENTGKAQALCRLAAALAVAAENSSCTHSVWFGREGFHRLANDRNLPSTWDGLAFEGSRSLEEDLHLMPPGLRRMGLRVLISDLLWVGDPLPVLRRLAEQAAELLVVQLLAQADIDPPGRGSYRLADSETGEELDLFIDASAEQRYRTALIEHQRLWQQACRQTRARFVPIVAESLLEQESLRPLAEMGFLLAA
jgi:uncharacterized protein (DUF58 family)